MYIRQFLYLKVFVVYDKKKMSTEKSRASKEFWLFKSQEISITLSFTPFTAFSFLILFLSLSIAYYKYTETLYYNILVDENKISWINVANEYEDNEVKSYISLDNGVFVYRHFYMDEFKKEFDVEPINFPVCNTTIFIVAFIISFVI